MKHGCIVLPFSWPEVSRFSWSDSVFKIKFRNMTAKLRLLVGIRTEEVGAWWYMVKDTHGGCDVVKYI